MEDAVVIITEEGKEMRTEVTHRSCITPPFHMFCVSNRAYKTKVPAVLTTIRRRLFVGQNYILLFMAFPSIRLICFSIPLKHHDIQETGLCYGRKCLFENRPTT
ncbi:hypothetical protein AHF37_06035 [Paragonimus kellicotti]|nr:hypothetical protein AHF37_06035 [Paragonimus kellicotti]